MIRHATRAATTALLIVLLATGLGASSPRFWIASTQADLLKGEVERLSIDDLGRLVLGPATTTVYDATVPFIWCLAAAPDGTVYAGTGNEGQVLRVDRQGTTTVWFDAAELEAHAIAVAPNGTVYVGTSPDGRVYRVDPSGKSSVFFDPEDKYIWSLALDPRGRLLVGTGDKGVVYRVAADGSAEVFYKTRTTHVTSLTFDRHGRVLAGTDSPGRIVRIDEQGQGFVLVDSPFREIRALRVDAAGQIYAAAVNGKATAEPAPSAAAGADAARAGTVPSVSTEITAVAVMDISAAAGQAAAPAPRDDAATPKGAVLRIDADGAAEEVWRSSDEIPYDLAVEDSGTVLVSTGNGGRIYRVSSNPSQATLVARVPGKQATAMAGARGVRFVAASNPARIVSLATTPSAEGSYVSEVRDAGTIAAWGTLAWTAGVGSDGNVRIFTRSGNTATPDEGWSPWAGPYDVADGETVRSPSARYLQWKAVLTAGNGRQPGPALASVSVAYLQRNLRPKVEGITVHPPGVVFQRPYPTGEPEIAGLDTNRPEQKFPVFSMPLGVPAPGPSSGPLLSRRLYQKGLRAFAWQARDDNDDQLIYDLHFRRVEDNEWRPLRLGTPEQIAVWDTTSVPDGSYVLRVTASDRLSNTPAATLSGELQTLAFDIDNTPPSVVFLAIRADGASVLVSFEVRDSHSPVERVEYSVDAGPWQAVFPVDGAADARRERYEIRVDGPAVGRVVLRVTDAMNNTGTARVVNPSSSPQTPARK